MIDTNELRRLAQAAMHPVTKGRWMRLFGERTVYDRMEDGCRGIPIVATDHFPPSLQEAAYLDFIAAANPATVSELLDRLERAESECLEQARFNGMGSEREAALMAKLEAAEKDIAVKEEVIDSLAAVVKRLDAQCDAAERERDECNRRRLEAADHFAAQTALMKKKYDDLRAKIEVMEEDAAHHKALAESALRVAKGWEDKCVELRAKITEMEQQEPVAWRTFDGEGGYDYRSYEDNENYKLGWDARNPNHIGWVEPLYVLPGALPTPSVPAVTATAYRWRYRGAIMWQYGELTEKNARLAEEHNHEVQPLYAEPISARSAPNVPTGWKLVPIKPTFEMLDKGSDQSDGYVSVAEAVWDAMIAAAPEAKP